MKLLRRKLYRSRSGLIFGVCKGLAEYLNVPAALLRTIWGALVIVTGFFPFAVLYLILAYFLPERDLYRADSTVQTEYSVY